MKSRFVFTLSCVFLSIMAQIVVEVPFELSETIVHDTHGSNMTTQGEIELVVLMDNPNSGNISWNDSAQVFELEYPSNYLSVLVRATELEPDRNLIVQWQLFGIIGDSNTFGPIHHFESLDDLDDSFSGKVGFGTNGSSSEYNVSLFAASDSGIPMSQAPANQPGCYWVMATLSDKSPHYEEIMISNTTELISYGRSCPTDDQDGDGWSDAQEAMFQSDPNDSDSNPTTVESESPGASAETDLALVGGLGLLSGLGVSTILMKRPKLSRLSELIKRKPKVDVTAGNIEGRLNDRDVDYEKKGIAASIPIFILDDATVDIEYSKSLQYLVENSSSRDVFTNALKGTIPDWLFLDPDGTIRGVPDARDMGLTSIYVRVTSAEGHWGDVEIRIHVDGRVGNRPPIWVADNAKIQNDNE